MGDSKGFPEPIFIGGYGRSGTHAIGPLVGADPRYHLINTEVRLHATAGGMPDLLDGKTTLDEFIERCWDMWWLRGFKRPQGVVRLMEKADFEAALEAFRADWETDQVAACRTLMDRIVARDVEASGKPAWVELTGRSVIYADALVRIYPNARFINIVRDGRAIAGGHVKKIDMTDDPMVALRGWGKMVLASHRGMTSVPPEQVLQIQLDDLVDRDREGTFKTVCEFLQTDDPAGMRSYFDRKITAGKAHVGQWRERMPPPDARRVDRAYRKMIRDLHSEGVWWAPAPEPRSVGLPSGRRVSLERLGPLGR